MLKALVVDNEMKLLNKKRRPRPQPKVVPASPPNMVPEAEDEDMEDE